MAHAEQSQFCHRIRARWPHLFEHRRVLDCGSADINGNNRYLFIGCDYTGLDIVQAPNVDVISRIHEYEGGPFDTIISTECFEHDEYFAQSIKKMIGMLTDDGFLIFTCATTGRAAHGIEDAHAWASPGTLSHYRNIPPMEMAGILVASFRCWSVEIEHGDIYGWGLSPIR